MPSSTLPRKRVNFMVSMELLEKLFTIPAGKRSNFVNEAIEEKFTDWGRRKALERLNQSIEKEEKYHTTQNILKTLHADRP